MIDTQAVKRMTDVAALPRLSILVAAWNESDNIAPFIHSYLGLTYPDRELVLCAGGTDATLVKAMAHVGDSILVLEQRVGEGKQRALRKAFEQATGDIIVLTDADCLLSQDGLMTLIDPIINGDSVVTTGLSAPKQTQLSHPFVYYQYVVQNRWNTTLKQRRNLQALLGRNCAISRAALEEVGAFDEDVAIGTDSFLAKKVIARGHKIRFVPASVVETEYVTSLLAYCRQRARWRRNAITHNLKFRHYRRALKAIQAPLHGLAMILFPLLSFRFGKAALSIWLAAIAWAVALRLRYIRSARESDLVAPPSVYWRLLPYLVVEWGAQALGLIQMLSPRTRRQW